MADEYVTRELFDITIQNVKEKAEMDKELLNARIDTLQAVMEKNFALLDEKLEHVTDTLTVAYSGHDRRLDDFDKRIDDIMKSQSLWFTVFGIIFAVATIIVPVLQNFLK